MSAATHRTQVLPVDEGGWWAGEPLKRRFAAGLLGLTLLCVGGWHLAQYLLDPARSAVTQVDVLGTLDYTNRDTLRERVGPHLQAGFYRLDIAAIRSDVMAMPWVSDVHIRRVWPSGLTIAVDEHQPAARWNETGLISTDLTLFHPPQLQQDNPIHGQWKTHMADLPRLHGAEGRHEVLLGQFRSYARRLAARKLTLLELHEDDRLSQTLSLAGGTSVRLGYEERGMRFDRFIGVHARVMRQIKAPAARFDMRYSNGFALSHDKPGTNAVMQDS